MALKFRLRGLAETFIETIQCPECAAEGQDENFFSTELTKVTFEGIVVVIQCRSCGVIFVPNTQRLGIINPRDLRAAVERDSKETGEPLVADLAAVRLIAERLNAQRRNEIQ
jgi:uncharacterized Zn finger protein